MVAGDGAINSHVTSGGGVVASLQSVRTLVALLVRQVDANMQRFEQVQLGRQTQTQQQHGDMQVD